MTDISSSDETCIVCGKSTEGAALGLALLSGCVAGPNGASGQTAPAHRHHVLCAVSSNR